MLRPIYFLLTLLAFLPMYALSQTAQNNKPRVLISTDIGGTDPDDNQSMMHLLMYSDQFEIEGLISSPSYGKGSKEEIIRMIDLFEKDLPILKSKIDGYPDPAYLRSICKQGRKGLAPFKGFDTPTEGSEWIVKSARKKSNRPLWILVWGGLEDVAQALHDAPDIQEQIRIYWIGGPNKKWSVNSYLYIVEHFPDLFFIENNASYRGFIADNKKGDRFNSGYYTHYIRWAGHMGADFKDYYDGNVKMGDTPSLLYLMNGDPENPEGESWGGSFKRVKHSYRALFQGNTSITDTVPSYSIIEWEFKGPVLSKDPGTAVLTLLIDKQEWEGYYLGDGKYSVKYSPKAPATLPYTITSDIEEMNGLEGSIVVDNSWPSHPTPNSYSLGNRWYTDKTDKELFEGMWQGSKTVSKWREAVLKEWGKRMLLLKDKVMDNGVPRDTSYTVQGSYLKEVKHFPFIQTVDTLVPGNINAYEEIVYKKMEGSPIGNRELRLSVYRPQDQQTYPMVLMIHGGGWNSGSPDMQKALAINLAKKGFVTATVEYRLIPEAPYPAAEEDINDALRWLYTNSERFNGEKNKIAVSGCSAGGQLAALVGTKNENGWIKGIINIDGISTFTSNESIDRAEKARLEGESLPVDAIWLGGTYKERSETWQGASALYNVHQKSAPICFINSSIPRFHNGRDEHIHTLDSLGIYSEVHTFDETPHTFWLFHPWHLSTVNYAANFLWKLFRDESDIIPEEYDLVVAQDGSGDYCTIQEAINAVPDFRKQATRILVRNGIYREKLVIPDTKISISLIGENRYKTIISYNNFASKKSIFGDEIGTSGSASVYVCPDEFTAENITFENAAGPVGQAVAIIVRSDRARFINCRFIGFQDTLYTHKAGSKQHYKNCYIEGTVDFIFGASTAFFEECEIFCKKSGYITAASTPEEQPYGYVFYRCVIEGEMPGSHYLGRPWRPYAHVAFIECDLGNTIRSEGWHNWGRTSNEETAKYAEYSNRSQEATVTKRVEWSIQFTNEEAREYTMEKVLGEDFYFF